MLFMACRAHCDRTSQPPARQPNMQPSCSSTQLLADLAARQTLMKVREVACIAERTCKDHASAVLEGMRLLVAPIVHRTNCSDVDVNCFHYAEMDATERAD
jgi:hypothetical protein